MNFTSISNADFFTGFAALAAMWFLFASIAHLFVKSHFDRSCFMDGYRAGRESCQDEIDLLNSKLEYAQEERQVIEPKPGKKFEPVNCC